MSQAPVMPLFVDAYLADTRHLTLEEHGAYLMILMVTWRRNGEPLPDDDERICRTLGISARKWRKMRPNIIEFFEISDSTWRQKRLEKEWNSVAEKRHSLRERGKQGGRPKSLKDNETAKAIGSEKIDVALQDEKPNESTRGRARTLTSTSHIHIHKKESQLALAKESPGDGKALKIPEQFDRRRGTRLPDDWKLSDEWREAGSMARREHSLPDVDLDLEAARFRDHWHGKAGKDGCKRDWLATWRNWCRNSRAEAAPPKLDFGALG